MAIVSEQMGTGRRKTASASVRVRPGHGRIEVNGRPFEDYFPLELQRQTILSPLTQLQIAREQFDLLLSVKGGGIEAQAVAARLGLARALIEMDVTHRPTLKQLGYLTRDPRRRERKKYGQPGARKRGQFSKR
jgi:small subunit ribosomal protein S9